MSAPSRLRIVEFSGLEEARYSFVVEESGITAEADLVQHEVRELVLRIGTGRLAGKVIQAGRPVRASVTLSRNMNGQHPTLKIMTEADGTFSVEKIAPGGREVSITATADGKSVTSRFTIAPKGHDEKESVLD